MLECPYIHLHLIHLCRCVTLWCHPLMPRYACECPVESEVTQDTLSAWPSATHTHSPRPKVFPDMWLLCPVKDVATCMDGAMHGMSVGLHTCMIPLSNAAPSSLQPIRTLQEFHRQTWRVGYHTNRQQNKKPNSSLIAGLRIRLAPCTRTIISGFWWQEQQ